jgi:hypothetical protein
LGLGVLAAVELEREERQEVELGKTQPTEQQTPAAVVAAAR